MTEAQQNFVASNLYSIAQAYAEPPNRPFAIYSDDDPVGFLMYAREPGENEVWFFRFMIGSEFQGQGFGAHAFELVIDQMKTEYPGLPIFLSYVPENDRTANFYRRYCFQETGEIDDGEILMALKPEAPSLTITRAGNQDFESLAETSTSAQGPEG